MGDFSVDQRSYQNACKLLLILEEGNHSARLVGGCVRDRIMGLVPQDYDIATRDYKDL